MADVAPPDGVLRAFGVAGLRPFPLGAGRGSSWPVGDLVLKKADLGVEELAWQARLLPQAAGDGLRLMSWVAAADGSLCVDGWCASRYLPGRHEHGRWAEIVAVGERFHAALRGVPRPAFLDRRSGPWAVADRVAWGELPPELPPGFSSELPQRADPDGRHLARLVAATRPVSEPSQLIHGDLTGNVLFDSSLPPAIIDLSPYWRPADYASAIVVADALVWEGADARVLDAVGHVDDFGQYLVRALIFRLVTDSLITSESPSDVAARSAARWEPAIDLACELAASRGPVGRTGHPLGPHVTYHPSPQEG